MFMHIPNPSHMNISKNLLRRPCGWGADETHSPRLFTMTKLQAPTGLTWRQAARNVSHLRKGVHSAHERCCKKLEAT